MIRHCATVSFEMQIIRLDRTEKLNGQCIVEEKDLGVYTNDLKRSKQCTCCSIKSNEGTIGIGYTPGSISNS